LASSFVTLEVVVVAVVVDPGDGVAGPNRDLVGVEGEALDLVDVVVGPGRPGRQAR